MADYDPTTLYGAGYQRDAVDPKAILAWRAIAAVFDEYLDVEPLAWLDIGCGPGGLIQALQTAHGWHVLGVEGSREALGLLPVPIIHWDLRLPLTLPYRFDVVSCFDVAEHIGNADAIAATCAENTSEILLFGAAPPGQDGLGHIDLRPHEEWTARFLDHGLSLDRPLTDRLRAALRNTEHVNHCWWVEKNLHAYYR